jgi:hypothetical protein
MGQDVSMRTLLVVPMISSDRLFQLESSAWTLRGDHKSGPCVLRVITVEQDSQAHVKMGTRTLYGSLKRMLADGLREQVAALRETNLLLHMGLGYSPFI